MKAIITSWLIAGLFLTGCRSESESDLDIVSFIPGTYVKQIDHEYAKGEDTITIRVAGPSVADYTVQRRSKFQQTIDGKSFKPRFEIHQYKGVYDSESQRLRIPNKEYVLFFNPDSKTLTLGSTVYKKVIQ
jgi:hypothetical protein